MQAEQKELADQPCRHRLLPPGKGCNGFPCHLKAWRCEILDYVFILSGSLAIEDTLFDSQTSGGLLIAIAPEYAPALMDRLQEEAAKAENRTPYGSCLQAAVIGYVKEEDGPSVQVVP